MGRATAYSAVLAGAYLATAGIYIAVSGELAADAAASLEELRQFELWKGLGFVAITGGMLFGLALMLFHRLARSTHELAKSREALLVADRQATPGLLAASIAHDFNNILTVLLSAVEELRANMTDATRAEILTDMAGAAMRGSELARRLSRAGRGSASGEPRHVDLGATVAEAVDLLRLHTKARRRELRLDARGPLKTLVYPALVHQIVTNLVVNALDAVPEGGRVLVRVERGSDGPCIEVHDDGPGVPPGARTRIFDPFYTTKGDGTGLGLLSVRTCAQLHRGTAEVDDSVELGGACFRVHLREPEMPARA